MKLKILGSGSSGNCYILESDAEALIIEAGISFLEDVITSFEKQVPKKPLGGADIDGNEYAICRECSAIVSDGEWFAKYCPDCGQAIDWRL